MFLQCVRSASMSVEVQIWDRTELLKLVSADKKSDRLMGAKN